MNDNSDDNIYQTPRSDLGQPSGLSSEFYIVSVRKFLVMYLGTLGLYGVYWFYKHWEQYRMRHAASLWPIPRAIFSIFFAHSLFGKIRDSVRGQTPEFSWSSNTYATVYVVLTVISFLSEILVEYGISEGLLMSISMGNLFLFAILLYQVQIYANRACDDPWGRANSRFTVANVLWLLLGAVLWFFTLLGIGMMIGVVDMDAVP